MPQCVLRPNPRILGSLAAAILRVLLAGIGAGSAYTTLFLFSPTGVTPEDWVAQLQRAVPLIGIPLFVVQPVAALATVTSAVLARRDRPCLWFLVAASIALIVAGLVTRFGNVPINFEIETWKVGALPANVLELQQRWWSFHLARSSGLLLALMALILATLTHQRRKQN